MLIEISDVVAFEPDVLLVAFGTPLGSGLGRWRGEQPVPLGAHHVEWTIDEKLVWGHNIRSARTAEPAVDMEQSTLVLRGQLCSSGDDDFWLSLGGAIILLDVDGSPPAQEQQAWVELLIPPTLAEIYPYQL